jgi:hypothetical protein
VRHKSVNLKSGNISQLHYLFLQIHPQPPPTIHQDDVLHIREPNLQYVQILCPKFPSEIPAQKSNHSPSACPPRKRHRHPLRGPLSRSRYGPSAPSPVAAQLTCTVGWSNSVPDASFSASAGDASIKSKLINLMTSVRTLMRSMFPKSP